MSEKEHAANMYEVAKAEKGLTDCFVTGTASTSVDTVTTLVVKQLKSEETEHCMSSQTESKMQQESQTESKENTGCTTNSNHGTCENCGQKVATENAMAPIVSTTTSQFISDLPSTADVCRICHCESENKSDSLITPCRCKGSMAYVHHSCLQRWIKSSGHKHCELCGFNFVMESKLKSISKWEKLKMSKSEKRRIWCSVFFHIVAIICVVWSLYVLIERTTQEFGKAHLQWPFWTKLGVVVIGLIGGLAFMYIQCKTYYRLCGRWMTFNRVVHVQNRPLSAIVTSPRSSQVEIPIGVAKGMESNCPDKNQCNSVV